MKALNIKRWVAWRTARSEPYICNISATIETATTTAEAASTNANHLRWTGDRSRWTAATSVKITRVMIPAENAAAQPPSNVIASAIRTERTSNRSNACRDTRRHTDGIQEAKGERTRDDGR